MTDVESLEEAGAEIRMAEERERRTIEREEAMGGAEQGGVRRRPGGLGIGKIRAQG